MIVIPGILGSELINSENRRNSLAFSFSHIPGRTADQSGPRGESRRSGARKDHRNSATARVLPEVYVYRDSA